MTKETPNRAARLTLGRAVALITISAAALFCAGCNTTEGVGKDVKSLGKGIEEAAQDAKD